MSYHIRFQSSRQHLKILSSLYDTCVLLYCNHVRKLPDMISYCVLCACFADIQQNFCTNIDFVYYVSILYFYLFTKTIQCTGTFILHLLINRNFQTFYCFTFIKIYTSIFRFNYNSISFKREKVYCFFSSFLLWQPLCCQEFRLKGLHG